MGDQDKTDLFKPANNETARKGKWTQKAHVQEELLKKEEKPHKNKQIAVGAKPKPLLFLE